MNRNTSLKKKVCLVGVGKHMTNKIIPVLKNLEFKIEGYVSSNTKKILLQAQNLLKRLMSFLSIKKNQVNQHLA